MAADRQMEPTEAAEMDAVEMEMEAKFAKMPGRGSFLQIKVCTFVRCELEHPSPDHPALARGTKAATYLRVQVDGFGFITPELIEDCYHLRHAINRYVVSGSIYFTMNRILSLAEIQTVGTHPGVDPARPLDQVLPLLGGLLELLHRHTHRLADKLALIAQLGWWQPTPARSTAEHAPSFLGLN
ncbi:MAG: hypothetical protein SGPRY_001207 [Prymnesium sp.]